MIAMNEKNEIIQINNISALSTKQLKTALVRGLEITAQHLRYLAAIWHELESRGEDLSDIRHGLLSYLPMIASGTVDPEIVVNYAGQKTLLSAISMLPIEEQRRLAKTGTITVINDDGDSVDTPISRLRAAEINRVFDISTQTIRSPDEQKKMLKTGSKKPDRRPVTSIIGFDVQDESDLIVISGKRAKICKVLKEISAKYPEKTNGLLEIANRFK